MAEGRRQKAEGRRQKAELADSIDSERHNTAVTISNARSRRALSCFVLSAFCFLIALLPRVVGLADFVTTDEAYHWIGRVEGFSFALSKGAWADTVLTGHPGVTLMWLGSLGLALERAALAHNWIVQPSSIVYLAWLRFPSALLEALIVPIAYLLLRRLVTPTTAFIAAVLWATSPFLIAHARLLHLDALLSSFVTLSVLALLVATQGGRRRTEDGGPRTEHESSASSFVLGPPSFVSTGWLLGSGVCAGLALLTKGPALILLPAAGVLLFFLTRDKETRRQGDRKINIEQHELASVSHPRSFVLQHLPLFFLKRLRCVLPIYAVWLLTAALVVVALWPALWVAPGKALTRYVEEISDNGGRPNGDGQFFLGRAVDDPGPLFYPIAMLFRTTPVEIIGLALFVGFTISDFRLTMRRSVLHRQSETVNRTFLLPLAAFALFWIVVMTLGPKKFDRYILPVWPTLLILAAAGLGRIYDLRFQIYDWFERPSIIVNRQSSIVHTLFLVLLLAFTLLPPFLAHPYYLSYYNPLLGGGAVAQRVLLIGWGEGMDQVGAYVRSRPDNTGGPVVSALGLTLQPFVPVPVKEIADARPGKANYAVVYLESLQRNADPAIYTAIQQTVPLKQISIHGIDYATIYQLPRPFKHAVDATFGAALHLRGITVQQRTGRITVTPSWDVRERPAADYTLFLHLLNAQGQRVAQVDATPGGDGPPTSAWEPGEQLAIPFDLFLPPNLPPGPYQLVLGLYDKATDRRLSPTGGTPANPSQAGPSALLVDTVTLK